MAAILVPSGDQTGPQPPRESIESIGFGAYQTSPFASVRLKPDATDEGEVARADSVVVPGLSVGLSVVVSGFSRTGIVST